VMQVEKPSYGMLRNVLDTLLHGDALAARGIGRSQREITGLAVESPINSALTAIEMWYEIAIGVAKLPNETKPSDEHDLTAETPDDEESTPRSRQLDKVTLRKRRELWDNAVGPQMLRIVNEATPAGRTLLRNALLQKWSDSAHDVVRILAHSLMARSHVLDGLVMDLPVKDRSGILVLDSRNVNEKYISSVFQLAQYLSVLSPLEIYHLGHRQEPIIWGIRDHTAVSSQDLWLPRPKPGLLMPIVDALTTKEVPLDPARCHFIAVLNIQPVTDCDDLFDELHEANKTAPIVGGNALAQIRARKAAATSPQQYKWQWNNKFLIVSRQPLPNGVTRLNLQLDNLTDSLNTLQIYLSKQIANTLRVLPVGQRWKDLNLYDVAPEPVTAENVSENLEIWVQQLDDINYTHPRRDTALTIGWSIITLSLENLPGAIEIVTRWLTPKKDEVGGQFKRQMGAACIRLLFNFYNADDNPQPETTGELLHLFPPFLESHPGYLEFVDVLHIVLGWARRDTWLDALINNEQDYFLEALGSIKQKRDVNQLFALIDRYKHLCQTVTFYLKLGYSWARFVEILSTVYAWREAMQEYKKKTRRKPPTLPSTISDTIADELNHFFGLPQAEQQWILGEISSRTDVFGASTTRDGALNEYKNLDTVVEAMRSRLQLQSQGKLPPLMGDGKYALVLIDIPVDKKVRGRVRDLSLNLLSAIRSYTQPVFDEALDEETEAQLRLRYGTNLTFTVHQLGKRQLLSKKAKIKAGELFTADSIAPAPLIGPILDRYSPEQVSCIIIVTASLIYDYDDWISDDQWREKFWMYKAGHWQPSWGNVYRLESSKWPDIDELKFDIEKIILNSVSQKERP
jgi:predicted Zn-dependent protease with MMP-like domain